MHGVSGLAHQRARSLTVGCESESAVGCDSEDWFGEIARSLLGKDAGFGLHLATGASEGSCYKYVARERPRHPPADLLRKLLRTDGGYQWLAAIMDGSDAPWWLELQRARDIADAIASIDKRLPQQG